MILEAFIMNHLDGIDWYFNKMLELIKEDEKYGNDELLLLIQDCEDYFHIEKSEGYAQRVCSCGVKDEIRYLGTKSEILREIEIDLLEYKYGDSD